MRKGIHIFKHLFGAAVIAALPAIACGCGIPMIDPGAVSGGSGGGAYAGGGAQNGYSEDVPNPDVPDLVTEGELVGLYYEKGGSMQARSDFMIKVNPEEIVRARYWPSDGSTSEIAVIEHVPISPESWQDIVKITDDLRQFMMVNHARYEKLKGQADPKAGDSAQGHDNALKPEALDGRPYTYLDLDLQARGEEDTIPYVPPQDRRFLTLENILMELADPIGREIVWYDSPELVGVYFNNRSEGYSFQCTENSGAEGGEDEKYKFYAYSNFLVNHFTSPVSEKVWERVKALCDSVNALDFEEGDLDDKIGGTLYMSDGRQKSYKTDKKTAEILRLGFEEIEEEIKAGTLK